MDASMLEPGACAEGEVHPQLLGGCSQAPPEEGLLPE